MLDFKPQKEIVYNRFLPYKDRLDEESNKFLSEIKYSLGRAVVFKETSPGILYWSNRLTKYVVSNMVLMFNFGLRQSQMWTLN